MSLGKQVEEVDYVKMEELGISEVWTAELF